MIEVTVTTLVTILLTTVAVGYLLGLYSKFVFRTGVKYFIRDELAAADQQIAETKTLVQKQLDEAVRVAQAQVIGIYEKANQQAPGQNFTKTPLN